MERYYKVETRTTIRMKVLDVLTNVIYVNRYLNFSQFNNTVAVSFFYVHMHI